MRGHGGLETIQGRTQMGRLCFVGITTLMLSGCLFNSTGPTGSGEARIRLHVTGGFAGVDYTFLVDGPAGTVVGESCVAGCDFQAGEILQTLSGDQVAYLSELFLEAGVHSLEDSDFGVQCCDQFHYDVTYEDGHGVSSFRGSSEALPGNLGDAVARVHGLLLGTIPIVVSPQTKPERWPSDPATLQDYVVSGDRLDVRVSYSGGCAGHDFKLVAWGGWMESYPVQVRALLSHDAKDDPCDAIVSRDLSFDLQPLKRAYQDSYGIGDPGSTALILSLANPDWASSLSGYQIEYVF